jgi:hypothetical protein
MLLTKWQSRDKAEAFSFHLLIFTLLSSVFLFIRPISSLFYISPFSLPFSLLVPYFFPQTSQANTETLTPQVGGGGIFYRRKQVIEIIKLNVSVFVF